MPEVNGVSLHVSQKAFRASFLGKGCQITTETAVGTAAFAPKFCQILVGSSGMSIPFARSRVQNL